MSFRVKYSPRFQYEAPIDPPLVPSAYDDEFESSVLDPSWERFGAPNGFNDVDPIVPFTTFAGGGSRWSLNGIQPEGRPSWYMIQTDSASNATIRKPINVETECFIWSRMSFGYLNAGQTNNNSNVRIGFIEPTSNDQVYLSLNESDTNTVQLEFATNISTIPVSVAVTNNVGGAGLTKGQAGHVVGIQKLGTTYHAWMQTAAGNWLWAASVVYTGVAPTAAYLNTNSITTSPGNWIVGFDFFRFKSGRYLP